MKKVDYWGIAVSIALFASAIFCLIEAPSVVTVPKPSNKLAEISQPERPFTFAGVTFPRRDFTAPAIGKLTRVIDGVRK